MIEFLADEMIAMMMLTVTYTRTCDTRKHEADDDDE